jgi:hypothetical protein
MEKISVNIAIGEYQERKPGQVAKTFSGLYIGTLNEINIDTRDKDFRFAHSCTAQVKRW